MNLTRAVLLGFCFGLGWFLANALIENLVMIANTHYRRRQIREATQAVKEEILKASAMAKEVDRDVTN